MKIIVHLGTKLTFKRFRQRRLHSSQLIIIQKRKTKEIRKQLRYYARQEVRQKLDTKEKREITRERLYIRDGKICNICKTIKKYVEREILTIDHIIPVFKGGSGDDENLQLLCIPCHKKKDEIPAKTRFPQWKRSRKLRV